MYIILNGEHYSFDIYDKEGIESDKVYFKGSKIYPCFYLKSDEKSFRIDFKIDKINILQINENHNMQKYIKDFCNFNSLNSSCWAVSKYHTSRPEKPPFNTM